MAFFEVNEGPVDRGIRAVVGVLALGGYLAGIASGIAGMLLAVIGVIALFTAVTGFCGVYRVLGINTCKAKLAGNPTKK